MTDREMLMFAYGALRALESKYSDNLKEVRGILENYLYPPQVNHMDFIDQAIEHLDNLEKS